MLSRHQDAIVSKGKKTKREMLEQKDSAPAWTMGISGARHNIYVLGCFHTYTSFAPFQIGWWVCKHGELCSFALASFHTEINPKCTTRILSERSLSLLVRCAWGGSKKLNTGRPPSLKCLNAELVHTWVQRVLTHNQTNQREKWTGVQYNLTTNFQKFLSSSEDEAQGQQRAARLYKASRSCTFQRILSSCHWGLTTGCLSWEHLLYHLTGTASNTCKKLRGVCAYCFRSR